MAGVKDLGSCFRSWTTLCGNSAPIHFTKHHLRHEHTELNTHRMITRILLTLAILFGLLMLTQLGLNVAEYGWLY